MAGASNSFDTTTGLLLAIEASPTGLLVSDADGTIQLVNRELERQFGYSRGEILGQRADLLMPQVLEIVGAVSLAGAADVPPGGPPTESSRELAGRRKDGSAIVVHVGCRPIETADGRFVLASVLDISERRRAQDTQRSQLERQVEFERFVAELSFQFINLPADQISDAIRTGVGRIGEELGLDRCSFFRIGPDGVVFDAVVWSAPGTTAVEAPFTDRTRWPESLQRLLAGDVVLFSTPGEIPNEVDRIAFRTIGTKSAVFIPLSVDGRVAGAAGFSSIRSERTWSPQELHRLKVFGSVFDQVLARQQRDEAMVAASREIQRLKDQLQAENVYLRLEERERLGLLGVVGQSAADTRGDGADSAGGGYRLDGAAARRDRNRQGTLRGARSMSSVTGTAAPWCA